MQINLSILATELRTDFSIHTYGNLLRNIESIEMVKSIESRIWSPDTLYILRYNYKLPDELPKGGLPAPFLCIANPEAIVDDSFMISNSAILLYSHDVAEVLLKLSNIMYRQGQNSSALSELGKKLLACKNMSEMLNISFLQLNNPVIITDPAHRILAYTDPLKVLWDEYPEILTQDYIPASLSLLNRIQPSIQESMLSVWPVLDTSAEGKPAVIRKALMSNGEVEGYLHVFISEREFTPEDSFAADLLGTFCTAELLLHKPELLRRFSGHDRGDLMIRSLMTSNSATHGFIEEQLSRGPFQFRENLYAVALLSAHTNTKNIISISNLTQMLSSAVPNAIGTCYNNSILLLIHSARPISDFTGEWAPLCSLLEEYGLYAGVSNMFEDIYSLRAYYYQALKAADLGHDFFGEQCIVPYSNCVVYHLIELGASFDDPRNFCDPGILRLLAHDKDAKGELVKTLRIYLENDKNKSKTAKAMYLHLSTVKYRIGQIEDLLNVDFSDAGTSQRLALSLKILEYLEANPRQGRSRAPRAQRL